MKDETFYYTKPDMVKDLIYLLPLQQSDSILDAGSGNKVWFRLIPCDEKYECEIKEGNDFFEWNKKVDWIIGNPPFATNKIINGKRQNLIWKWIEHSSNLAKKGMGFLLNHKVLNFLTPVRLQKLKSKGFEITKWHIVTDKRWFGRYYFIIFEKKKKGILSWECKSY